MTDTPPPEADPFVRFDRWFAEAVAAEPVDANAMALATATAGGVPSVRMVLLKGHDAQGMVFYTNLHSRKAEELAGNRPAALLFHWKSLARQIRIEGQVAPVADAEADAYFASRGRLSQLGAWASDQSRPVADAGVLPARVAAAEAQFPGAVTRPPHWSGLRLAPQRFEFWRDRPGRLHERLVYTRDGDTGWRVGMLYP